MYNQEIKGNLARLLATENLVVEHRKVATASFNVDDRVLTLPLWEKASETVYDLLVGHEVGHALYTPGTKEGCWEKDIPHDYYNVVEDARIEKMIKRRYPGLARDFFKGYTELNNDDFFEIKSKDLSTFSLIDRINLHFKIGAFALVPFQDDEKHFLFMIEEAETFADVTVIVRLLNDFIKRKKQEKVDDAPAQEQSTGGGGGTTQNVPSQEQGENANENANEESNANEDASVGNQSQQQGGGASGPDEERSETQKAFDQNAQGLNTNNSWNQGVEYIEIGKNNLDEIIVPFNSLHKYIEQSWISQQGQKEDMNLFEHADKEFRQYKASAQQEVNYLVKEFECKKSADAYARAATSKTGVLDTSKLHTYKYNDDLFKKVTVLPDGKNHGMIFILDWSGSMGNIIEPTVKQLINLMWFCRKVQIPFELYAFTYEWNNHFINPEHDYTKEKSAREHLKLGVHQRTSLLNFVSSSAKSKDFEKSILNLYRFAYYFSPGYYYDRYNIPMGCDLSGTPLNDAIITLHDVIPAFQKQTGSQKTTVCILTDGESAGCQYSVKVDRHGNDYIGSRTFDEGNQLRDRKLGKTYKVNSDYRSITQVLLQNLKDKFPEINLVGFRIGTTGDFTSYYRYVNEYSFNIPDIDMKKWKKEKSWEFNNVGYDSIYFMANTSLSSNTDFDVADTATKTQIKSAFVKSLKSKKTNKKILSSFAVVVS
jgi:hypothetical protein